MRLSREQFMMEIAELSARRSTCQRLQIGAVITDGKIQRILSYGYNGNYSGGPNKCDSKTPGNCGCIHGEINVLLKNNLQGEIIFITNSPCLMCAKAIINSGIKRVYYRLEYRDLAGLNLLKKVKIKVIKLK